MKYSLIIFISFTLLSCLTQDKKPETQPKEINPNESQAINATSIVVLGTIQDAGSPQIGCTKECCVNLFKNPDHNRKVVSLGLIDTEEHKSYLFDATPDISSQSKVLKKLTGTKNEIPNGIFLTHAHIGHYTGLMYLGKEAINSNNVVVYAMPKMKVFLQENGPWNQLIENNNISIKGINDNYKIKLSPSISVTPMLVPHRDEFSETVGYIISGKKKKVLFIPDIDKWEKWDKDIIETISLVDYAFIDGTFYDGKELNNRDISEIPHPFIIESIDKFKNLPAKEKKKIYFIHFNHTNPLINSNSKEAKHIKQLGFNIATINQVIEL